MKKIIVCFCSQALNKNELEEGYGKYHVLNSRRLNEVVVVENYANKTSLSKRYNELIRNEDVNVALMHDDALIRDEKWIEKLNKALEAFDIVGLAGGSSPKVTPPCLWHLMCSRDTYRGRVSHVNEDKKGTFVTDFGEQGRVLILDGVFLAFNSKKLYDAGVKFDETNPAKFHFYDIDFCLTCNSKKLKLGTTYIDLVHNSHGLRKYTDEWLSGQAWFMQKFADGKYNF